MTSPATASPEASLVRALGVRQLAASIVNVTVGAGIFVLPAAVAAGLGAAAPAATMIVAGLLDPRMKIEIEVTARRPAPGSAG
jgi:APA family basic amino acid/polyamine antiporter